MDQSQLIDFLMNAIKTHRHPLKIFGLNSTQAYAQQVAKHMQIPLTAHDEHSFSDGECYLKSGAGEDGNVRGHNVFVIQSLYSDAEESVNDKLMKLLIFCGSLRQASVHKLHVVIPHLAYARQDMKDESRAPVTTKIIASLLEAVGIDHALFFDVHSTAAEQNAFSLRTPIDILEVKNLHADWCAERLKGVQKVVGLSPDAGGYKRTSKFCDALAKRLKIDVPVAVLDKVRSSDKKNGGKVSGGRIIGDVEGAQVICVDDMISTAGTVDLACKTVVKHGGHVFAVLATHGLFSGKANDYLSQIDAPIVVADTVAPWRLTAENLAKVQIIDTTKMTANAIWRIHSGTGSISELLS